MATNEEPCLECYDECYDCDSIPVNSQTCIKLHEYNDLKIQMYSSILNSTTNPNHLPKILAKLSANLWCLNSNEIALLCNLKTRMEKAEKDILDLDKKLDAIQGLNFKTLVKGVDYNIYWRNGWSTPDMDMKIKVSMASNSTSVQINTSANLSNSNLRNAYIAHAHPVGSTEWLNSRIFTVVFLGKYAPLNTASKFGIDGNSLLNVKPVNVRGSWSYTAGSGEDGTGQSFTLTSYADGYNTQFTRYPAGIYTTSSNFKYHWTTNVGIQQ